MMSGINYKVYHMMREMPLTSTKQEEEWMLETWWWLQEWKTYIKYYNYYLYWSEPGHC